MLAANGAKVVVNDLGGGREGSGTSRYWRDRSEAGTMLADTRPNADISGRDRPA